MKKNLFYVMLSVLLLALTSVSCGSDDNDNDEPDVPTSIEGHWLLLVQSPHGTGGMAMTFESNGTGYVEMRTRIDENNTFVYNRDNFTYSYNDNTLTVTLLTGEEAGMTDVHHCEIDGNILHFTTTVNDEEEVWDLTKSDKNLKDTLHL